MSLPDEGVYLFLVMKRWKTEGQEKIKVKTGIKLGGESINDDFAFCLSVRHASVSGSIYNTP